MALNWSLNKEKNRKSWGTRKTVHGGVAAVKNVNWFLSAPLVAPAAAALPSRVKAKYLGATMTGLPFCRPFYFVLLLLLYQQSGRRCVCRHKMFLSFSFSLSAENEMTSVIRWMTSAACWLESSVKLCALFVH